MARTANPILGIHIHMGSFVVAESTSIQNSLLNRLKIISTDDMKLDNLNKLNHLSWLTDSYRFSGQF